MTGFNLGLYFFNWRRYGSPDLMVGYKFAKRRLEGDGTIGECESTISEWIGGMNGRFQGSVPVC